jgi:glycosyltransferase involved in cell wall biosynthesis
MEAQALGIPVVAYDLPWAREFIIDGVNGYKAHYPNTAKLAEGVVKAARLNASAVMLSAEKYDRKRTLRKLESVLE